MSIVNLSYINVVFTKYVGLFIKYPLQFNQIKIQMIPNLIHFYYMYKNDIIGIPLWKNNRSVLSLLTRMIFFSFMEKE